MTPFLKWAGGKRWLLERDEFAIPHFEGKYIEPFLGSGAIFFSLKPKAALLSDANSKLIETYTCIRDDWKAVFSHLQQHHERHNKEYYYKIRSTLSETPSERASQFIYLNRTCWNGLYRENLNGQFNVPIGTKNQVICETDNFEKISALLKGVEILCSDFEETINKSQEGDFLFIDPPYTTAHNCNGFIKYNEKIFTWSDQERLRESISRAVQRGSKVILTNADHDSVRRLYDGIGFIRRIERASVISGLNTGRRRTAELLIEFSAEAAE